MKRFKSSKIHRRLFLAICLILLIFSVNFAERLPIKIYTSADGLGSSFVDYLMRDSRGFMWFCTRDGLSRFDGARFITYQIGDSNSPPGVQIIKETSDGMYWIMTTGGMYRFNPNEISQPDAVSPRLNAEFITDRSGQIFEDSKGNVWMSTGGLSQLKQIDGKISIEPFPLNLTSKVNVSIIVIDIVEAPDGSIWLNSSYGIVRILPDRRIVFYPSDISINSGNNSLMADKNGKIWVAVDNQLLIIQPEPPEFFADAGQITNKSIAPTSTFELKPNEKYQLPEKAGEILEFKGEVVNTVIEKSFGKRIFQTSDGNIWITAENYLLQFANGILSLHTDKEGLPNVLGRMTEDTEGNLWIGSRSGLARIDRNGLKTYRQDDGANSSRFFAVNEADDGTLYFASRDFYLNRYQNEKFDSTRPSIPQKSDFLWTSRFSFLDSNNGWWFLTSEKLYHFANVSNFEELRTKPPTEIYSTENGLKSNGIFQIFESSGGDIWVSTRDETGGDGTGIARLKKGEKNFFAFSEADGLPKTKAFSSAVEDANGNIWISFYNGGLARFADEKFEIWGEKEVFGGSVLPDLHLDKKGRLWIGSSINGLFRLDNLSVKNSNFIKFSTANGLLSNNIRTITEDNLGRIYVGTARGVDRLEPDTGQVKHYSVNDGLAADFVVDSHADKNGNLWFVTNDGVSKLTPLPEEKKSVPRILLGGLTIAGEPQPISQLGSAEIAKGELESNQNNLQIEFFGLDFRAGETLRYQYKFDGADWSAPTEQRSVNFANLSPATYRFLVRAVNSEGAASENPAVVSFKILPPIWARWWFIALCILVVGLIAYAFYRYRISHLETAKLAEEKLRKSREERLAELEQVRTRIATDLHDDIGASLTQIAILSEVAQQQKNGSNAEPLTMISSVSNELVGTMSDIVWAINPTKDHLHDLTLRMRRFASDVLSAKDIDFEFDAPENEISLNSNLRREVFLIFKESINNIVKHSEATEVEIEFEIFDTELNLTVKDNGRGFELENFAENSSASLFADYVGGNGLLNMKRRAAELGGEFEIFSEKGKGTTVTLNLPLKSSELRI